MIRTASKIILVIILLVSGTAHAQLNMSGSDVNVSMNPSMPGTNQMVSVYLTSYILDINTSNITWRINGKTEKQGVGEKSFSFTTGGANTTTTLSVTIRTKDGETISKTIPVKPADVDLVWESGGFTPPFYKGKTLFAHQNRITFIAVPHIISNGVEVSAKNLTYSWKINGSVMEKASGYGKNSLVIESPLLSRGMSVEVTVTNPSTGASAFNRLSVEPVNPFISVYKKDPIYGIQFQKAWLNTTDLKDMIELELISIPFSFSVSDLYDTDLEYKWSINGGSVNQDFQSASQVFRKVEGVSGTANISLNVTHRKKILQTARNNFGIYFAEKTETNPSF